MTKVEKRKFDAEIGKVLQLMIHSLYTNKDIFLRELISNASDAFDKLRFEAATNDHLAIDMQEKIVISCDKKAQLIKIRDFGIGMNKDDLIDNLGTIASSGTQKFVEMLSGDKKKDVDLIGQFGVGFYSAFMVAEDVTVKSKKAGEKEVWCWQSNGQGEFSVFEIFEDKFQSGTEITLRLKEDAQEYLDKFKISNIVKTYSEHISVPIEFQEEEKEAEVLNNTKALWNRAKSDIDEESYNEFYKQLSFMPDGPWMTLHNKNEGTIEYTNLLFIPASKPFDLFNPERKRSVKLYIKRVFINDEGIDLIPHYLRFLRGVVDSQDLPLNISRETLQHNKTLEKIKSSITKKVLSELSKKLEKDRENYQKFWNNFGAVLKEGLCEYGTDHESLLDLSLFKSVKSDKYITLKEYIDSMPSNQKDIFYISGNDEQSLKNHPQIEGFASKGIDVLLFTDTVDGFWVNVVHSYKEKDIKSVTRSDIDLENNDKSDKEKDAKKDDETASEELINYFKEQLKDIAKDVKISKKLTESPVCLAVAEGSMDIRMERFLAEQKQLKMPSTKILEINTNHPIIKSIAAQISDKNTNNNTSNLVKILFDQACILEGEPVNNAVEFSKRMNDLLTRGL